MTIDLSYPTEAKPSGSNCIMVVYTDTSLTIHKHLDYCVFSSYVNIGHATYLPQTTSSKGRGSVRYKCIMNIRASEVQQ